MSTDAKTLLAAKITSKEAFEEALDKAGLWNPDCPNLPRIDSVRQRYEEDGLWWLRREVIREHVGVYPEPTSVLTWLRTAGGMAGQYFPHVSAEDPTMIAFTPDAQNGKNDKQVRTTMGKFLRKYLIVVTDKVIADLEATHRAELDDTFEIARTAAEIENVYRNMEGDSGCMRHPRNQFHLVDYHPSAIYEGPGLGVAYIKGVNGGIKARSVIYENPDDPTDKRYVRLYGDAILGRKLQRAGYQMAGLAGVKIRKLRDKAFTETGSIGSGYNERDRLKLFVMPYVDHPGGNASGNRTHSAIAAMNPKDSEFLILLDEACNRALNCAGLATAGIRGTSGYTYIEELDLSQLNYTCALSGVEYDKTVVAAVDWLNEDGTVVLVSNTALMEVEELRNLGRYDEHGRHGTLRCTEATRAKFAIKHSGYENYFDDEHTRRNIGLYELDARYYPGEVRFVNASDMGYARMDNGDGVVVLKADLVKVFDENGDFLHRHISDAKLARRQGYVTCAPIGKLRCISHPQNPSLVTTLGGKRALLQRHELETLYDGSYEFSRNTRSVYVARTEIVYADAAGPASINMDRIDLAHQVRGRFRNSTLRNPRLLENLQGGYGDDYTFVIRAGALVKASHYDRGTLEELTAAARYIVAHAEDPALADQVGNVFRAVCWAKLAVRMVDYCDDLTRTERYDSAQANALDYSDPTSPGSATRVDEIRQQATRLVDQVAVEILSDTARAVEAFALAA